MFLAGTAVLQTGYFLFLLRAYRAGDLSAVYPIGRGAGALLAALGGIAILGERPGPAGLAGIGLLVAGVIVLGMPARTGQRRPPPRSCCPGHRGLHRRVHPLGQGRGHHGGQPAAAAGLRRAGGDGAGAGALRAGRRGRGPGWSWRRYRRQVLGAALLAPLAYILVLMAMTFTSVAAVAPAREVSVLFGVVLGRRLLGEGGLGRRSGPRRSWPASSR